MGGYQYAGLHECGLSVFDQWRVTVPTGERVRLTFTSFDLVPEVCGDFVQVFDGYRAGSSSLGKHDISDTLRNTRGITCTLKWAVKPSQMSTETQEVINEGLRTDREVKCAKGLAPLIKDELNVKYMERLEPHLIL